MTTEESAEEVLRTDGEVPVKENIFKRMYRNMTLEPLWFGIATSNMIGVIAFKNYYLQRACLVDLGYSEDICLRREVGANYSQIESESQEIIATINVGCGFVGGMFTMLMVLFLGPWSDASAKRRPLILYPILGMLVGSFNMLVMQAFPNLAVKWVIYLHAIPIAMGGQFSLLTIACYSYLGDVCTKEGRCLTTVIGSNNGFFSFFMVFGTVIGPIIYRTLGFTPLFIICFFLELLSFLYAFFTVKDVIVPDKIIPKIYDLRLPFKALKCVFKKREGHKRRIIMLIILITCCNTMLLENDSAITYLYLRKIFSWTEVEYSMLLTLKNILYVIGNFFIVIVLKRRLKMKDRNIGVIGGISLAVSYAAFMLSISSTQIFAARFLSILSSGVMLAERPTLLKQIQANEQGRISSITSIIDNTVAFIVAPLSNYIYLVTMNSFPSCYMFLSISAGVIQTICYAVIDEPTHVESTAEEVAELKRIEDLNEIKEIADRKEN